MEQKLQTRLSQQLVMTPQLQQAIRLLQLSQLELREELQRELERNPLLEAETPAFEAATLEDAPAPVAAEPAPAYETGARAAERELPLAELEWRRTGENAAPEARGSGARTERFEREPAPLLRPTLQEHLRGQLRFSAFSTEQQRALTWLLGSLNDDGYLDATLEEIARSANATPETARAMLAELQALHPSGVAARDLRECLQLQLKARGWERTLLAQLIAEELERLTRRDLRGIARSVGRTLGEVAAAAALLKELEPRPGRGFGGDAPVYIAPDLSVQRDGEDFRVLLNEDGLPKLRLATGYRAVLESAGEQMHEARDYVRERLRAAQWLIKSIHQRQRTIARVMESIAHKQRAFFTHGALHLRPLTLREVADDIGMHESTVSRVTTNKYVQTPQGLFELKYFFRPGLPAVAGTTAAAASSESVRERIRRLLRDEDPDAPLSDQRLVELLAVENIAIARRTVTKYRRALNILSSTKRRRVG